MPGVFFFTKNALARYTRVEFFLQNGDGSKGDGRGYFLPIAKKLAVDILAQRSPQNALRAERIQTVSGEGDTKNGHFRAAGADVAVGFAHLAPGQVQYYYAEGGAEIGQVFAQNDLIAVAVGG